MNTATASKQQRPQSQSQSSSVTTNIPKRKFTERELPFVSIYCIYSQANPRISGY